MPKPVQLTAQQQGHRVMRISLPVPLIRAMDGVILQGLGGYATRNEFIVDAIQERVLELTVPDVEDANWPLETPSTGPEGPLTPDRAAHTGRGGAIDLSMTALARPIPGLTHEGSRAFAQPEGSILFGLHNRDFPSLWALSRLADITASGPIPFEDYIAGVCEEAWQFGELLLRIEQELGGKRTALFPTNREKKKAAEAGFRTFAIGDYRRTSGGLRTSGPLFEWHAATLLPGDGPALLISATSAGRSLLEAVAGATVAEPHAPAASRAFFNYIARYARADWSGFLEILDAVGPSGAAREAVLRHVAGVWPSWTDNEVSTNAAGYMARAREWGLVEPKQSRGRYHLTPLGLEHVNGANT